MRFINWLIGVPVWTLLAGAFLGCCYMIWDYFGKDSGVKARIFAGFLIIGLTCFVAGILLKILYYVSGWN